MTASASTSVKARPNPIIVNSTSSVRYSVEPLAAARKPPKAAREDVITR
jgi:hypothetical protein